MIDISSAKVKKIIIHKIGNKLRDEGFALSEHESAHTSTLDELLLSNYLRATTAHGELYDFHHESDLTLNAVHHFSDLIFQNPDTFTEQTKNIAKHLYSVSTHPNIGGGEFISILFDDIRINEKSKQALGMFRIEGKNDYLDVEAAQGDFQLIERTGISLEKIQKGAIAISGEKKVYIVDSLGKKTKYWLDSFLKATPSRTPQACAKTAGSFVKAISSKTLTPEAALEFSQQLTSNLSSGESISFGKIKEISSQFASKDEIDETLAGITNKFGIKIPDTLEIDTRQLSRHARDVIKKAKIANGISLVISSQNIEISSMEITKTKTGIIATIEIQLKEE